MYIYGQNMDFGIFSKFLFFSKFRTWGGYHGSNFEKIKILKKFQNPFFDHIYTNFNVKLNFKNEKKV